MYCTTLSFNASKIIRALGLSIALQITAAAAHAADFIRDAQNYIDKRQYAEATIQLKNALQKNPENVAARIMLGELYLKTSGPSQALKELEKAYSLSADNLDLVVPLAQAYLYAREFQKTLDWAEQKNDALEGERKAELLAVKGQAYLSLKQLADAQQAFEASNNIQNNADAMLGIARLLAVEEDADAALAQVREVLEKEPDHTEALFLAGQLALGNNDYQQAIDDFSRVVELLPPHTPARLARAESYLRLKQFDQAERDADWAIKQQGDHPTALFIKARLQFERKKYDEAVVLAERTLRAVPNHLPSFYLAGSAHYAVKNYEQAQFYLQKYYAANSGNLQANRILAATLAKLGDLDAIIDMLESAAEQGAIQDGKLLYLLGSAYFQTGELTKGNEIMAQAIELEPDLPELKARAAIGKMAVGDIASAVSHLQAVLAEDEGNQLTRSMLVMAYLRGGQVDDALRIANQGIEKFPDQASYYHLKAAALQQNKQPDKAKAALEQAISKDPEYTPSLFSLAQLAGNTGNLEDAESFLDTILKAAPGNLRALLAKSAIQVRQNNPEGSLALLDEAIEAHPTAAAPIALKANHLLRQGEQEKALAVARQFEQRNPQNLQAQSLLARILIQVKRYPEAQLLLQGIVNESARDVSHRMLLVGALTAQQDFSAALAMTDQILSIKSDLVEARIAKINILKTQKEYAKALAEIDQVKGDQSLDAVANQLRGDIYLAQGNAEEGLAFYQQAFTVIKNTDLVRKLSQLYLRKGDYDLAVSTIEDYLNSQPNDALIRMQLAEIHQSRGQAEQAIEAYEAVLSLQPDLVSALNNLAWTYNERGDKLKRALELAERAYQLVPDNPDVADTYGWVLLGNKQYKKGLKVIQQAADKSPANPDIRYHLAAALIHNGQEEEGQKLLARLLKQHARFSSRQAASDLLQSLKE